ncbi:hypothetical protein CBR_g21834 [Chara braunii]|uniref:Protein arginine N-methyltransferase domain-containing protein n=1 Tax=Chara braunii TaxID=69332 RepID=A0A388JUL3_CHABU|nr:hypothetical protein CBR_g21834 [Chara braunii]|eukprot:GBG61491.1 hypothetical protein CBR_g21834 [Chara braunii]
MASQGNSKRRRRLRSQQQQLDGDQATDLAGSRNEEQDDVYFDSYSHLSIHEEMIKDHVRTDAYLAAIRNYADTICGKVVIDVGCGTGILSIFCAQVGARHVYAIDASEIAVQAKRIVEDNGLSDRVTVIHGRVEEVELPEKADIIVSEWMGYMLFYENMLRSVIVARDRWLKPDGLMMPSHATLYIAPITYEERYDEAVEFWNNVYGIDMSSLIPLAKRCAFEEPVVEPISAENVLTWPAIVTEIDCATITVAELEAEIKGTFSVSSIMNGTLNGFVVWFDVVFRNGEPAQCERRLATKDLVKGRSNRDGCDDDTVGRGGEGKGAESGGGVESRKQEKDKRKREQEEEGDSPSHAGVVEVVSESGAEGSNGTWSRNCIKGGSNKETERARRNDNADNVRLSTAPEQECTHWQQTALYIDQPLLVRQDQVVNGALVLGLNKDNPRFLDIHLEFETGGALVTKDFVMR